MLKIRFRRRSCRTLRFTSLPSLIVICLFSTACTSGGKGQSGTENMKQTDIVAGYGEKTFPQTYNIKLSLPVEETSFIELLKRLRLHYRLCGRRGSGAGIPPARQQTTVDLSKAQTCYEIDGDRDPIRHIGQAWRAFADQNHQIFYIENVFAYTGP